MTETSQHTVITITDLGGGNTRVHISPPDVPAGEVAVLLLESLLSQALRIGLPRRKFVASLHAYASEFEAMTDQKYLASAGGTLN